MADILSMNNPTMDFSKLSPDVLRQLLGNGFNVQNPNQPPQTPISKLIPGSDQGSISPQTATPAPPTSTPAQPTAAPVAPPAAPQAPSGDQTPYQPHVASYEEFAQQHPAQIPSAPVGPFDNLKHPLLAKIGTLLGAFGAEVGGRDPWGTDGRPGMGEKVMQPFLDSVAAKRKYQAEAPALQQQAQQKLYEDYVKTELEKSQSRYYSGFQGKGLAQNIIGFNSDGTPIFGAGGSVAGAKAQKDRGELLGKYGLRADESGNISPETDRSKLSLPMQSQMNLQDSSIDLKNAQAEYEKYKMNPNSWMAINAKARVDLARVGLNMRQNEYMINNYGYDMDGRVPPGIEVGAQGQPIGAKFQKNFTPTTASRSSAEFATTLQSHLPEFEMLIQKMDAEGKLGPIAGRWNDFMAGKVGEATDPEYATLRTFGNLFDTGLMKAHFGSKGGVEAMEHFQTLIDTGKMDAATLVGALEGARPYLDEYARMGTIQTSIGGNIKGGVPGSAVPPQLPATPVVPPAVTPPAETGGFAAWQASQKKGH